MPDAPRLHVIGVVRSSLARRADAPRQGDEGAPDATILLEPSYADALQGIRVGDALVLLTWLHEADRSVLQAEHTGAPPRDGARDRVGCLNAGRRRSYRWFTRPNADDATPDAAG